MRGAPKGVEKEEVFEGSAATKDGILVRMPHKRVTHLVYGTCVTVVQRDPRESSNDLARTSRFLEGLKVVKLKIMRRKRSHSRGLGE